MPGRSRAREVALQALHRMEFNPGFDTAEDGRALETFLYGRLHSTTLSAFAAGIVHGVARHRPELDAELDARNIKVTAVGGRVTLAGTVRSWDEREEARSAAWSAPGVTDVVNDIGVKS